MTHRSIDFALAVLAASLAASPLAASRVVAQEAIMLETIGAVRMARPEEIKRMNDEPAPAQQRRAAPTSERHAAAAD